MKIQDLSNNFTRAYQDYRAKDEQLTAQINRAENRLEKLKKKQRALPMPRWIDTIVQPIADELAKELPNFEPHILGPFGICSEISIHFYRKGIPEKERWAGDNIRSITFIPGDLQKGEILIRDTSVNTGQFRPGTIGELNGMNHPSAPIPQGADVLWLLEWVR